MTCLHACDCDRDVLARKLLPVAMEFVGAVHDQGSEESAAIYATVPIVHTDAFAVVLAALVDVDQTQAELLAWVPADEELQRLPFSDRETDWTPTALAQAHRLYARGVRDARVSYGQRIYERQRGRRRRERKVA